MPFALFRYIIFFLFCIFIAGHSHAQKRNKSKSFYKGRYKSVKVSKAKAKVVCPIFEHSKYPYQGIGVKLGDPFAVTYKFYATKNFAVAIDFGSAASGLYNKYHRDNFINYSATDSVLGSESISYLGHKVKSEWVSEGKLLYHHDASKLLSGLQWYIGAGWQLRQLNIEYEYFLEINSNENELGKFDVNRFTMGPTGALGLEYAYFELPVSAFLEIEMFSDMVEDPGWIRFQGGVGIRYVF
ncbi:hypothetical protein JMN32_07625 [Fulvivirga sp. 29W222]|uniref:Uncharacterized protein n=1 Tax=Fulvivirga marina TaxID=2494733 RepID=A0A937FWV5_9BACT|nr:hypothetical protein [Fulvivirga marina]MBL6446172.1 hypothetical protein [Fulvivirga marina]